MRVAVIGAGGLGAPVLLTLARAGRGLIDEIAVIDDDRVELSNLHRQLLFCEGDIGKEKAGCAADVLQRRAPWLRVRAVPARLAPDNALGLLAGSHVLVEGSDSISTKFLVSDSAVQLGVPAVIGGVVRFAGQIMTVLPGAACYRCLFEEPPERPPASCQQAGVLGPSCGVVGALQASEVLRLLAGERPLHAGSVLTLDLLEGRARAVNVPRRPECPACAMYWTQEKQ